MRLKYFRRFWLCIDLGIIACSIASGILYYSRFQESNRLSSRFKETSGYVYINLQWAVYVNDILTFVLGFCLFFSMIKFIRLLKESPRLSLFAKTLKILSKDLLSFSVMFSIVFVAFQCLFYLLFVARISSCSSLLGTAQMLFEMTLMKFDASELSAASAFLGPTTFSLFIVIVVFVCFSMFISIINDGFKAARETVDDNEDLLHYIFRKFLNWTGKMNMFDCVSFEKNQLRRCFVFLGFKKDEEILLGRPCEMLTKSDEIRMKLPVQMNLFLDKLDEVRVQ